MTPADRFSDRLSFSTAANSGVRVSWMSRHRELCFGIYLLHPVFLNLFYKFLGITPLAFGYGGIFLFWAAAFLFPVWVPG